MRYTLEKEKFNIPSEVIAVSLLVVAIFNTYMLINEVYTCFSGSCSELSLTFFFFLISLPLFISIAFFIKGDKSLKNIQGHFAKYLVFFSVILYFIYMGFLTYLKTKGEITSPTVYGYGWYSLFVPILSIIFISCVILLFISHHKWKKQLVK